MSHGTPPAPFAPVDVSALFFERPSTRRIILTAYWAVVVLAIPLWWSTTSIQRLALPSSRIRSQATWEIEFPSVVVVDREDDLLIRNVRDAFAGQRSLRTMSVVPSGTSSHLDSMNGYTVNFVEHLDHPVVASRRLSIPSREEGNLLDILLALMSPYSSHDGPGSFGHLVAKYSPRYRLAFTLLNEDAAQGMAVTGWDIKSALSRHINPVLQRLAVLHNFTVESQVHFYAPLAFDPVKVSDGNDTVHGLTPDDLKVFVNSAEWSLASSVSNDPVLHFIMFIPSTVHTPLRILDAHNEITSSNAFILPQWGGIFVANQPADESPSRALTANELDSAFSSFRVQLLTLLGMSNLPQGIELANEPSHISEWQLDTLYRQRALENTASSKETLESIVKLVDQIPNMPIGQDVKGDVQVALTALEKLLPAAFQSPTSALQYSADALTHASRAFFNPSMLALLYFPPEHKYAVYTPLFAPMVVPLVAAALREIAAWRKSRREPPTAKEKIE